MDLGTSDVPKAGATARGGGSSGGQRLSLADYVTGMEPTGVAVAAGRVLELATLFHWRLGSEVSAELHEE